MPLLILSDFSTRKSSDKTYRFPFLSEQDLFNWNYRRIDIFNWTSSLHCCTRLSVQFICSFFCYISYIPPLIELSCYSVHFRSSSRRRFFRYNSSLPPPPPFPDKRCHNISILLYQKDQGTGFSLHTTAK